MLKLPITLLLLTMASLSYAASPREICLDKDGMWMRDGTWMRDGSGCYDDNGKKMDVGETKKLEDELGIPKVKNKVQGCRYIGNYSRAVVNPTVTMRCGGGSRPAVLCKVEIYCNQNSDIHKEFGLGDEVYEGELTCLGDAEGNCPGMMECAKDEDYQTYEGAKPEKVLSEQKGSLGVINQ